MAASSDRARVAAFSIQRMIWRFRAIYAEAEARRAVYHADWYCGLPWWKRQLALVLGL